MSMSVTEVVSPERKKIVEAMRTSTIPKTTHIYAKGDAKILRAQVKKCASRRKIQKRAIDEMDSRLKNLRRYLYEAELQHTPITILASSASSRKEKKKLLKPGKMTKESAEQIIQLLLKQGLINQSDLAQTS